MLFIKLKWNWFEKIYSIVKKKNDYELFYMGLKLLWKLKKKICNLIFY